MLPRMQAQLLRLFPHTLSGIHRGTCFSNGSYRQLSSDGGRNDGNVSNEVTHAIGASQKLREFYKKIEIEKRTTESDASTPEQNKVTGRKFFSPSKKGMQFLQSINERNTKYSRGGQNGEGYIGVKEAIYLLRGCSDQCYTKSEQENPSFINS